MELVRIDGTEAVGELFDYTVQFIDTDPDAAALSSDDAVGRSLDLKWEFSWSGRGFSGEDISRVVHGLCSDFQFLGRLADRNHYQLTIKPQLWLATQKTNSRLFKDMTLQQIIEQVLNDNEITNYRFSFTHHQDTLHYTVQYQETDFDFISRLLQKYGSTYVFTHSEGRHEVEFRDANGAVESAGEIPYHPGEGGVVGKRHFSTVNRTSRLRTNEVALRDWDPAQAGAVLEASSSTSRSHAAGQNEVFVYPGGWDSENASHGQRLADLEAERATSESQRILMSGYVPNILPGQGFTIGDNPVADSGTSYVLLRAQHSVEVDTSFRSGGGGNAGYFGSFEAIPDTLTYPPRKTVPWPKIVGPQTAIVSGEGEIDIDDDGRILVKFHWDRDQQDSRRVRVAQLWAGNQWGASFVPRVGMEVVVDFIGGDPDRPLVTGCVYNSENVNPVLPANKTRSGFYSNSSEGGNGFNFIGFDDLAGEEEVYIHAQKDFYRKIENDEKVEILNDQTITIDNNRTADIGNDDTLDVGNNLTVEAVNQIELKVGQSTITITSDTIEIKSMNVKLNGQTMFEAKGMRCTVDGSANTTIKGGMVNIN